MDTLKTMHGERGTTRNQASKVDLASAWMSIISGHARIGATYSTESRHVIELVQPDPHSAWRAPTQDELACLMRRFEGTPHKVVAYDTSRSLASISALVRRLLARFGQGSQGRQVPLLLLMMCKAWQENPTPANDCLNGARVITVVRPDMELLHVLTPAEHAVIQGLVDGRRYSEIARERKTAFRTVANQIASAYRKLGVSGRSALMVRLVARTSSPPETQPRYSGLQPEARLDQAT